LLASRRRAGATRAATHQEKNQTDEPRRPADVWSELVPELRALVRGWIVPVLVGIGTAILVGLTLGVVFGHHDPGTVSSHNFAAMLTGLVAGTLAFARGERMG
jgi:hypothetical protein